MLQVDMWLGYCAFHMGDYKRAMLEYEALTHAKTPPKVNLAILEAEIRFSFLTVSFIVELTSNIFSVCVDQPGLLLLLPWHVQVYHLHLTKLTIRY